MALVKESQNLDGFNVGKDDFVAPKSPPPSTTQVPIGGVAPAKDLPLEKAPGTTQLPVYKLPTMPEYSADDRLYVDDNMLYADDEFVDFDKLQDMLSGEGEVEIQVGEDEPEELVFDFGLDRIPGAEDQSELELEPELKVEEEEDEVEMPKGPWEWTIPTFMAWLQERLTNIPKHPGHILVGVVRARSYLEKVLVNISKACQNDLDGVLDIKQISDVEKEILDGIKHLKEREEQLDTGKKSKKSKKSSEEFNAIVKEASKSAAFVVTVPLFISSLARTCLNAMVSNGKDIEQTFDYLAKKFDLTKREEAELMQLLSDMGYAMRRDRGLFRDEKFDATSTDNPELAANYPG